MSFFWPYIFFGVILIAGFIFYLMKFSSEKIDRQDFLQKFAHFFEGQVAPISDHEKSFRVNFHYRGHDFIFEDISLPGLKPGFEARVGYLKIRTPRNMTLLFSERSRTQIRSNVQTLDEITKSRWGTNEGQVRLPRELEDFHAYTNKPEWANRFVNDPRAIRFLTDRKNRDSRGHPVISLQIVDGVVALEFHSEGGLQPSLLTLEQNVTSAEPYLLELIGLADLLISTDAEKA